jgi:hypothetical protein
MPAEIQRFRSATDGSTSPATEASLRGWLRRADSSPEARWLAVIRAVTVKVPDHAPIVRAALAAGKHMLLEWPSLAWAALLLPA